MRREMKLLGVALLAALSLMAVTAAGAQAEKEFRVEGKILKEGEAAEAEGTGGASKLSVPGLKLTIECGSTLLKATFKNFPTFAHAEHHLVRHNCIPIGWESCSIYPTEEDLAKGLNSGLLLSSELYLVVLFGKFHYWVLTVTERFFFGGVFCTLPKEVEIKGETAVRFGNATTEAAEHTMEDITATEEKELKLPGVTFNGEPAEWSGGNTAVKLVGKFAGKKYSLN